MSCKRCAFSLFGGPQGVTSYTMDIHPMPHELALSRGLASTACQGLCERLRSINQTVVKVM